MVNMTFDFISGLQNLGLTESEARVYLANLELGPSSVLEITKQAKISRTAAYDAVEALKKRGLLSTIQKGKKTVYVAEDVDRLMSYLKERKTAFESQMEMLEKNIADLRLVSGGEKPTVKFFQGGKEALDANFAHIKEKSPKILYELSNVTDVRSHFTEETLTKAQSVYDPKKTKIRILHIGDYPTHRKHVEYCQLDKKTFGNFHGDIQVYSNTVSFMTFKEGVNLVIIENEIIAETMMRVMQDMWKRCKK